MDYEKEFEIFSSNINQAARSFYYHIELNQQVYDDGIKHQKMPDGYFQDSKFYQAVDANAQFWMDYKHGSILFVVIVLGRIFDPNPNSYSINRLVKSARESGFTNEKLRERKIKGSDNSDEWIEDYMSDAHELLDSDFEEISNYAKEACTKWSNIKDLRNKIYAHQDVIDEERKIGIFQQGKYSVLEELIEQLLTLEHIFFQAFHNGKKPDFDYKNEQIKNDVVKDVASLLERLSND